MEFKVGDRVQGNDTGNGIFSRKGTVVALETDTHNPDRTLLVQFDGIGYDAMEPGEFDGHYRSGEEVSLIARRNVEFLGDSVSSSDRSGFEQNVHRVLDGVADTVVSKNQAYGDSALNPVRIFSKTDRMEQLFVRLDDKLSRVQKGHEYPGDDTIRDIIGYCTLILIAKEGE